jgi:RHS repeat-associated protein
VTHATAHTAPGSSLHDQAMSGPVYTDRYEWDGREQLRRIVREGTPETVLYTAQYDAEGSRVRANVGGTTHEYSYGAGLLHDTDGGTTYTPGIGQRRSGVDSYFHEDWLGSTRYTTAADGTLPPAASYRFDAFGNVSAFTGVDSTASKYAGAWGYRSDAGSGLQMLGLRHYDPVVGRFLNPDPIGHAGGLNLYGYVDNDPVNGVDPSGLQGVGHHYVPQSLFNSAGLPADVVAFFDQATTGPIPGGHNYSGHGSYNKAVRAMWNDYLKRYGINPRHMTVAQAERFLYAVKKSRNPLIRDFLNNYVTRRFSFSAQLQKGFSKVLQQLRRSGARPGGGLGCGLPWLDPVTNFFEIKDWLHGEAPDTRWLWRMMQPDPSKPLPVL